MGFYEDIDKIDFKELVKLDKDRERPITGDAVDQFIYKHLFDVRHNLECALEDAKYDLVHGSDRKKKKAAHKVEVLCDLLYSPPDQESIEAVQQNPSMTEAEKAAQIDAIHHRQKRKRGRPQADTSQNAIRALSLYRERKGSWGVTIKKYLVSTNRYDKRAVRKRRLGAKDRMDWREIAKEINGCKHPGSTATRSCEACGTNLGRAVSRLRQTLKEIGIKLPDLCFPRTFRELDKEIAKLKRPS
jgi:hypothetical protein